MGKTAIITPLYISVAWILMTSYQFFTQTTVITLIMQLENVLPTIGAWLSSRLDLIIFIHSFAWIFLLSSAIPSLILGKERGIFIQFCLCLTITFSAFIVQDVLMGFNGAVDQILGLAPIFQNPFLAIAYLSLPYILMIAFDIRCKRKQKMVQEIDIETDDVLEHSFIIDNNFEEEVIKEEQVIAK